MQEDLASTIVEYLRKAAVYRDLQRITRESSAGSQGFQAWEKLTKLLIEDEECRLEEAIIRYVLELQRFYRKSVFLQKVELETRQALLEAEVMPLDFSFVDEIASPPNSPKIVQVSDYSDGREYVIASRRKIVHRTQIPPEAFTEDYRLMAQRAEKAILVTSEEITGFDVVAVPRDDSQPIEIRVAHHFTDSRVKGDAEHAALDALNLVGTQFTGSRLDFSPIDVFPVVDRLYRDDSEGRVTELRFDCATGVSRTGLMRRSNQDLRREEFHVAGAQVTHVWPYYIEIALHREIPSLLLVLPGRRRNLLQQEGLIEIRLLGARTETDYQDALAVVRRHLGDDEPTTAT